MEVSKLAYVNWEHIYELSELILAILTFFNGEIGEILNFYLSKFGIEYITKLICEISFFWSILDLSYMFQLT